MIHDVAAWMTLEMWLLVAMVTLGLGIAVVYLDRKSQRGGRK